MTHIYHQNVWTMYPLIYGWLHGTVVERRSLTGELFLSHARSVGDNLCG